MKRRDIFKIGALSGLGTWVGATAQSEARSLPEAQGKRVKGVVFMVSDGMSPGVLTLAEAYSQLTRQKGTEWCRLLQEGEHTTGLMDTASANSLVTDSAAASSAWGSGQRVENGRINVSPKGEKLEPIAAVLKRLVGAQIGLVTTATVTHATPAGFAANAEKRSSEADIAIQYLQRVDVILGGGRGHFDRDGRSDGRDLTGEFRQGGYEVVHDRKGLEESKSAKLLGLFHMGHLPFRLDRNHDEGLAQRIPKLPEMAKAALSRFLASDQPFLLQVEGARIDHAAHLNDIGALLAEQLEFDDAIVQVMEMVRDRDDILVVITSDHGNSNPGLNGTGMSYAESNACFERITQMNCSFEKLFEECKAKKLTDVPLLSERLKQAFGYSITEVEVQALLDKLKGKEIIEWSHQQDKPEGLMGQILSNYNGIGWTGTSHTSDPTLITAVGPGEKQFAGMVKNCDVFGILVSLLEGKK